MDSVAIENNTPSLLGAMPKRFTRRQYIRLYRLGFLGDRRVELIGGVIEQMSPQYAPHAAAIELTRRALEAAFGSDYWVPVGCTLNLGPGHMPDPDLMVQKGWPKKVARTFFKTAELIIEVSDTTLWRDRVRKGSMYAATKVNDYWIVNLVDTQLEVYRNPHPDPSQVFCSGYEPAIILKPGQTVAPLAVPTASIPVADLFPR
jgi:Uma2 family endonuclease